MTKFPGMHPRLIELREEHGQPSERSANKVKDQLSEQVIEFIQASPFAVLSSSDKEGNCDASPRGGLPGFVKIVNEKQLFIPDIKGNRLFHSFSNFHSNPKAGMVFFIPGSNMTVRVNGRVELIEQEDIEQKVEAYYDDDNSIIIQGFYLHVDEAYTHCPRALQFSDLWNPEKMQK